MTTTLERRPLTDRQQEVFQFVWLFREQHGYCCTIREVCHHFGFTSPNGALCHLWPLRRKGWITWEDGQNRTLRPVEVVNE
jgi:repressor LexA